MLYALASTTIAMVLLGLILIGIELGYRFGRSQSAATDASLKDKTQAIDSSILGMLSLLLGFTFTMALQHHDTRHHAMIEEANAIGTAWFRAELLPGDHAGRARTLLRDYLDLRLEAGELELAPARPFEALAADTLRLQRELWREAAAAVAKDPSPVRSGLFAQAVTDVMDAQAERNSAVRRHVPAYIIMLLMTVALASAVVTGYSAGLGGQRPAFGTAAWSVLVALVVFMIADLDRPRRGLAQVGQENLVELRAGMPGAR
jgi:hypothetical protein